MTQRLLERLIELAVMHDMARHCGAQSCFHIRTVAPLSPMMLTFRMADLSLSIESSVPWKHVSCPARRQSLPRFAWRNALASNFSRVSFRTMNSGRATHGVLAGSKLAVSVSFCSPVLTNDWLSYENGIGNRGVFRTWQRGSAARRCARSCSRPPESPRCGRAVPHCRGP